ncbi:MAG TPA: hypothetical protein VGT03_07930 [Candidatus Acidoferrales bacterium]|nr:hypothetical protein [Candidatus Acidoferrales bacterium]
MGKNRIWYVFLWLMLVAFLIPLLHFHFDLSRMELRRSNWATFLSPAAYLFVAAMFETILFPMQILSMIPAFFVNSESNAAIFKKRYGFSLLAVFGICVGEFVLLTLMWGSQPLELDAHNYVRLRLIPFFPWPTRDFLVFQ